VLHSGGMDSTVCLLQAQEAGHTVISLGVQYGQRHSVELQFAEKQAARYNIERRLIEVHWDKPVRQLPQSRTVSSIREAGVSPAFLPARNLIFLALASGEAAGVGATQIWTGINSIDFSGYPDCTPEFLESFSTCLDRAYPNGPRLVAPLLQLSKPQIAQEAKRLGLSASDTWSCYRPEVNGADVKPCGRCDACVLHAYAWQKL